MGAAYFITDTENGAKGLGAAPLNLSAGGGRLCIHTKPKYQIVFITNEVYINQGCVLVAFPPLAEKVGMGPLIIDPYPVYKFLNRPANGCCRSLVIIDQCGEDE